MITSLAVLVVFENAGLKLTSVITSLGMGGILVAVSSQALLQDIIASLTLIMDKPFEKGDYITAGGRVSGTVENIGLKTTRIRDSDGSLLVLPNRDLCNTAIDNHSRMAFRYAAASPSSPDPMHFHNMRAASGNIIIRGYSDNARKVETAIGIIMTAVILSIVLLRVMMLATE
jgi:hypothetical protein